MDWNFRARVDLRDACLIEAKRVVGTSGLDRKQRGDRQEEKDSG